MKKPSKTSALNAKSAKALNATTTPIIEKFASMEESFNTLPPSEKPTALAWMGNGGYPTRELVSDEVLSEQARAQVVALLSARDGPLANKRLMRFEMYVDASVTPIDETTIYTRAIREMQAKLLSEARVDAICNVRPRAMIRHADLGDAGYLFIQSRALIIAPADWTIDLLKARIGIVTKSTGSVLPDDRLTAAAEDISENVKWLLARQDPISVVKDPESGKLKLKVVRAGASLDMMLRVAECESQLSLGDALFGIGSGIAACRTVRSKLSHFQKARLATGMVLDNTVSAYRFWDRVNREHGIARPPARFDTPMKLPMTKVRKHKGAKPPAATAARLKRRMSRLPKPEEG